MNNQPRRRSDSDDSSSIASFNQSDLSRIDGDISLVLSVLADDRVKAFLAAPRVMRKGKIAALEQILKPKVHPIVSRFVVSLAGRAGVGALVADETGISPKHYAASVVELAKATGCAERLPQDLVLADSALQTADVKRFLAAPAIRSEGKGAALRAVLEKIVHPIVVFVALYLQRTREIGKFSDIARRCMEEIAESANALAGEVITAVPIATEKLLELEIVAGMRFGRAIRLTNRVDRSMLGGVLIKAGELVLDGTIDHRLEAMRRSLSEAGR